MPNNHYEDDLQKAVFDWAKLYRMPDHEDLEKNSKLSDYLFAIPNGAFLAGNKIQRARQMARLKSQGLKPGVFDLMLNIARNCYYGLDMELKIVNNKLSSRQKEWRDRMDKAGRYTVICYDLDQVKEAIDEYINL